MTSNTKGNIVSIDIGGEEPITRNEDFARELQTAMSDILHDNQFLVSELGDVGVDVVIEKAGQRVVFRVAEAKEDSKPPLDITISTKPLRGLIRDYFIICESYLEAIRSHDTRKIEAVDMGRRGMHNEGAEIVTDMLEGKVTIDHNTARRLFTLVAILHMK